MLVGGHMIDGIHYIQSLDDLSKNSVHAIEMGRSTNGPVILANLRRKLHGATRQRVGLMLDAVKRSIGIGSSPNYVEMSAPPKPVAG